MVISSQKQCYLTVLGSKANVVDLLPNNIFDRGLPSSLSFVFSLDTCIGGRRSPEALVSSLVATLNGLGGYNPISRLAGKEGLFRMISSCSLASLFPIILPSWRPSVSSLSARFTLRTFGCASRMTHSISPCKSLSDKPPYIPYGCTISSSNNTVSRCFFKHFIAPLQFTKFLCSGCFFCHILYW